MANTAVISLGEQAACTRCKRCWLVCPEGTIGPGPAGAFEVDLDFCKGCGICARECPRKAIRMAKEMGPGHTIVTILCDYGNRYQSKLFNPAFLREKNLPLPPWMK